MAIPLRRPPSQAEADDFRAREYYDQALYQHLSLVGTATVDVGSINGGAVGTFTITVTGCRADKQQTVQLAPPSAIEAGLVWCAVVSADDTVTVRLHNTTGSPIDPAEALWGARVMV